LEIDLTSLITGAGFTIVAGWLASFIALRKDEKSIQITQIIQERTKWRGAIRDLTQNIAITFSGDQVPLNELKEKYRAALVTSLNPISDSDNQILTEYDTLKHLGDLSRFTLAIALLLKHDWERVKWECMPIYKKLIKYIFKANRAWRKNDYRALPKKGLPILQDNSVS
jgi:hypothetical protein